MKHLISIKTKDNVLSIEDFKAQGLTNNDVIGIIIQTETIGIIMSLDTWEEVWNNDDILVNKACGEAEALQELSGIELTRSIVDKTKKNSDSMNAAIRCWDYGKGGLQWYLPSLYELGTIIAYRDEINEVLDMLDMPELNEKDYGWSSSENGTRNAWGVLFGNGNFSNYGKCYSTVVRAVSAFSPLERGDFSSPSGKVTSNPTMTEESAVEFLRSIGYTGDLTKKIHL